MSIKKLTAIILSLVIATGSLVFAYADTQENQAKAKDYSGHWAESTIQKWIDSGKINGYPDGSFKPDDKITRAEFVQLVNNSLVDYSSQAVSPFSDVKSGEWYAGAVNTAYATDYIKGYSQTQFGPTKNITREQAAAIMSRIQYLADNSNSASAFSDTKAISPWAVGQVGAAKEAGFINGYNNKFMPLDNLTRAEAVTMLNNVMENGKNKVVYKAGTELKDTTVAGDLIIAKTVGEGDVHLTNVEVKGTIKVYGGGMNSLYFNNVKVAKIEVEKEKVRLVFDNGTTVQELSIGTEAKLENLGGTIVKVVIDSTGKVTLAGNFQDVVVESKTNIVLDGAKISSLVVEEPISIIGTGTIAKLTANADGIQYDSTTKITTTALGTGVTEKPAIISAGGGGGFGGGPGTTTETKYNVTVTSTSPDLFFVKDFSKEVVSTDIISDVLLTKAQAIKTAIDLFGIDKGIQAIDAIIDVDTYLAKVNSRLDGIVVGSTPLYIDGSLNETAWTKLLSNLTGTTLESALDSDVKSAIADGLQKEDLSKVLPLYNYYDNSNGKLVASDIESDIEAIVSKLVSKDIELNYNGEKVTYNVAYKTVNKATLSEIYALLTDNDFSAMTVGDFYKKFGNTITITATAGGQTATTTISIVQQ